MRRFIALIFILFALSEIFGQRPSIALTFSAVNNTAWVQLDSLKVMNRTQGGDTVLYYPDTVLVLDYQVGIPEPHHTVEGFQVFQNYPNPVADQTTINLYVPSKDMVSITVTDVLGRVVILSERVLDEGLHSFRFTPGDGSIFFFAANWRGCRSSTRILRANMFDAGVCSLEYLGNENRIPQLKVKEDIQLFTYELGDNLLYIGYSEDIQSGILDAPDESKIYTFQFATNFHCRGTPTVNYDGQVYTTIQIFSQCWLKENLNVGTMIPGTEVQTNNGIIEKYCYNNEPDSCSKYGALYQWDEMMQYATQQGAQGICPPGWHIPIDEEWKLLEGAVDSQYGIGDPEWDNSWDARGFDVGMNLKSTSGWYSGGNGTDLFDFSGLPGGYRLLGGFDMISLYGFWWTSSENDYYNTWGRCIYYDDPRVCRNDDIKEYGFSLRCIRDEVYPAPIILTFTAFNNASYVQLDSIKVMNRTQEYNTTLFWPDTSIYIQEELPFNTGDELLFIGYSDTLESGIHDSPLESKTYTFQFAAKIPCPGTPTVEYEGQIYHTIQIFSQCWLKENLNVGMMIQGGSDMTNNGLVEKYCYGNNEDTCILYGGLYSWSELMNYILLSAGQGICPEGWHIPSLMDWAILKGAVDSYYRIEDTIWQSYGYQGFDVGLNLKSNEKWSFNGNGNGLYGFNLLPAGYYNPILHFAAKGQYGNYWTSDKYEGFPWKQVFDCWANDIRMLPNDDEFLPVRCIKNNP